VPVCCGRCVGSVVDWYVNCEVSVTRECGRVCCIGTEF
jgi:hypothetical protein